MNQEFFEALELMAKEKEITAECLAEKVAGAIGIAVRKDYPGTERVEVVLDPNKKKFQVSLFKTVVEQVEDPANEITLEDAAKYSKKAKLEDEVEIKLETKQFGRIAAQAAKHGIRQGVQDAEREVMSVKMGDKVGKIVNCTVVSVDGKTGNALVRIDQNEFMLFASDQLPDDHLQVGDSVRVFVVGLSNNERRCSLKISRTHKDMISSLFAAQVPEIEDGTVEIKGVSREPGLRSKIAVYSQNEDVDPVGACIGPKSMRIAAITEELSGEKIDIIPYSEDPAEYIARALAPAKVVDVQIYDQGEERIAFASVVDSQLSLAIGNKGQNAKLAARLTGFKIDISPESGFYGEDKETRLEERLKKVRETEREREQA